MDTRQQYVAAMVIAIMLGVVGLMLIGMGFGLWLSIQTLLDAGCRESVLVETTACQEGMQAMSTRSLYTSLMGIGSVMSGGGIMVYLRRVVP